MQRRHVRRVANARAKGGICEESKLIETTKERIATVTRHVVLDANGDDIMSLICVAEMGTLLTQYPNIALLLDLFARPLRVNGLEQSVILVATGPTHKHLLSTHTELFVGAPRILVLLPFKHPRLRLRVLVAQPHNVRLVFLHGGRETARERGGEREEGDVGVARSQEEGRGRL